MATLITKNSSTASSIPTAAQLVQGELAVNVADKRLFTENSAGAVVELGTNPSSITTGTLNATGGLSCGGVITTGNGVTTEGTGIEIGGNRTGSGSSLVDFHSTPGTDFEARLIRNSGANGDFLVLNTGTGGLALGTNNTERFRINSSGNGGLDLIHI